MQCFNSNELLFWTEVTFLINLFLTSQKHTVIFSFNADKMLKPSLHPRTIKGFYENDIEGSTLVQ